MDKSDSKDVPEVAQFSGDDRCGYCGAELNRRYYFCLRCSRPYVHPDTLMPSVPRFKSTSELLDEHAPQVTTLFWSMFATVLFAGIMTGLVFQDTDVGLGLMLGEAALACVTLFFAIRYWDHLSWQFAAPGFQKWEAWLALPALGACLVLNYVYGTFLENVLPRELVAPSPWELMRGEGYSESTLVVLACLAPAIIEEVAFRGLIQHWLGMAMQPRKALVIASALFAAMHFSILSFPYLFLVGLLLGWTWWKTRSLYPCMLVHFLHNFVVIEFLA